MLNTMPRKITPEKIHLMANELRKMHQARNEEIVRLYDGYLKDPATEWTLERIGEKYGLTKQRVWAIWKRYRKPD
jgi:DNA-directed RNA polymerase sigma subunit (sigma70/sigma32)